MKLKELSLSALLAAALLAPTLRAQTTPTRPASLLADIKDDIPVFGTPGTLAIWGAKAESILAASKDKNILAPVAARGTLGTGRVVCFAHTGYVGNLEQGPARALLGASIRWARRPGKVLRIAAIHTDCEPSLSKELGTEANITTLKGDFTKALTDFDCLIVSGWELSNSQVEALINFAKNGGGIVAAQTAWAWNATDTQSLLDNPLNKVMAAAGIAWTSEYGAKTGKTGFTPAAGPSILNASEALKTLLAKDAKVQKDTAQAAASLVSAARLLPAKDLELRPKLQRELRQRGNTFTPSESTPLQSNDALGRALIAFEVSDLATDPAPPAHRAAPDFPGTPPTTTTADASVKLSINLATKGWHSTGLYAIAGKPISINISTITKGLRVRIGCHKDELWHLAEWKRIPDITLERPLTNTTTTITSAFGGPVYIVVPDHAQPATLDATLSGGCLAPLFVLGTTSSEAWKAQRSNPAPWAELVTSKVALSVPSQSIRTLDDPESLMRFWERVLDAQADLATIPRDRTRPQRYVADRQISAGYMHSGYPIMTHLDAAADMSNLARMQQGPWGLFHELGHNHQAGEWTFDGTGEVTCNLFAMYTIETVCGKPWIKGHDGLANRDRKIAKYIASGRKFETWKSDPFLALQMYAQLVEGFGWDTFKKVFTHYRELPKDQRPRGEDQERDQWMVQFSLACGKNLGPFFDAWGIPTSNAAHQQIATLPPWMPADMPPLAK